MALGRPSFPEVNTTNVAFTTLLCFSVNEIGTTSFDYGHRHDNRVVAGNSPDLLHMLPMRAVRRVVLYVYV